MVYCQFPHLLTPTPTPTPTTLNVGSIKAGILSLVHYYSWVPRGFNKYKWKGAGSKLMCTWINWDPVEKLFHESGQDLREPACVYWEQLYSNSIVHHNHREVKSQMSWSTPEFLIHNPRWGPTCCIANKLPGQVDVAGPGTTGWISWLQPKPPWEVLKSMVGAPRTTPDITVPPLIARSLCSKLHQAKS